MSDVVDFNSLLDRPRPPPRSPVDSGGGSGNDGGMEQRVSKIEAILPTLATKADLQLGLQGSELRLVKWAVGIGIAGAGLVIGALGLMLQAHHTASVTATPVAPIIINVPAPGAAPAASSAPAAPAE